MKNIQQTTLLMTCILVILILLHSAYGGVVTLYAIAGAISIDYTVNAYRRWGLLLVGVYSTLDKELGKRPSLIPRIVSSYEFQRTPASWIFQLIDCFYIGYLWRNIDTVGYIVIYPTIMLFIAQVTYWSINVKVLSWTASLSAFIHTITGRHINIDATTTETEIHNALDEVIEIIDRWPDKTTD